MNSNAIILLNWDHFCNDTYLERSQRQHKRDQSLGLSVLEHWVVRQSRTLSPRGTGHCWRSGEPLFWGPNHWDISLSLSASRTDRPDVLTAPQILPPAHKRRVSQVSGEQRWVRANTLSRVTWSSCDNIPKPGMRLAKSTTPLIAGEKRSLKSSRIRFVPPLSMTCCGKGLRGQAYRGQDRVMQSINWVSVVKESISMTAKWVLF